MSQLAQTQEGKPMLVLPAILDITAAAVLKQDLQHALAKGGGLEIDASAVRRLTTPCLQVLVAGLRAFAEHGFGAMHFYEVSSTFRETASCLGLETALGLGGDKRG